MSIEWITYVCLFLGLSTALVAGVFQSFSDFVMSGLFRAAPAGGIESMQQLNRTVFRSVFLATFLALVPVSIGFGIYAWIALDGFPARLIIAAALIYVPFVFIVTAGGNVPMNERLDKMDHTRRRRRRLLARLCPGLDSLEHAPHRRLNCGGGVLPACGRSNGIEGSGAEASSSLAARAPAPR